MEISSFYDQKKYLQKIYEEIEVHVKFKSKFIVRLFGYIEEHLEEKIIVILILDYLEHGNLFKFLRSQKTFSQEILKKMFV